MADHAPESYLPGQVVMSWEDAKRMATTAAMDAAAQVKAQSPSREELLKIAQETANDAADRALERLLERIGADGDDGIKELRKTQDRISWKAAIQALYGSEAVHECLVWMEVQRPIHEV